MIRRLLSRRAPRAVIGLAISAAFIAATASSVDAALLAEAWAEVGIGLVLAAGVVSLVELNVRAVRWRRILGRLVTVDHKQALGFLSLGHLANAILPARLGDVTRAVVTGTQLSAPRSSVLGTIALERVSDAAVLGMAVGAGVLIGFRQLAPAVAFLLVAFATAVGAALLAFIVLRAGLVTRTRLGAAIRRQGLRFWEGVTGLESVGQGVAWVLLTVGSFVLTILIFSLVASAVGLGMPIWQAALIIAAVTLSTAIPAGPASIGTYEFVGMTVMVSMGFPAEPALLAVALVHAVVVVPPAALGLGAMWWLGMRPPVAGSEHRGLGAERP